MTRQDAEWYIWAQKVHPNARRSGPVPKLDGGASHDRKVSMLVKLRHEQHKQDEKAREEQIAQAVALRAKETQTLKRARRPKRKPRDTFIGRAVASCDPLRVPMFAKLGG